MRACGCGCESLSLSEGEYEKMCGKEIEWLKEKLKEMGCSRMRD